jgi:hypothetical protein
MLFVHNYLSLCEAQEQAFVGCEDVPAAHWVSTPNRRFLVMKGSVIGLEDAQPSAGVSLVAGVATVRAQRLSVVEQKNLPWLTTSIE